MGNPELDSGGPRAGFIYYRLELNPGDGMERARISRENWNRIGKEKGKRGSRGINGTIDGGTRSWCLQNQWNVVWKQKKRHYVGETQGHGRESEDEQLLCREAREPAG